MSFQYKKNIYKCKVCKHRIVTIDRDKGTTPFLIGCTKENCKGLMQSNMYRPSHNLDPEYEWYYPTSKQIKNLDPVTKNHVESFGLLMRKIGEEE